MSNVDLGAFDTVRALTLRQAIDTGRLTFRGRKPTLLLVQRWSNPKKGCKPLGPSGPHIVLSSVLTGRERMVMPEWIDWFVQERTRMMVQSAQQNSQRLYVPPTQEKIAKRVARARKQMREPLMRKAGVKC